MNVQAFYEALTKSAVDIKDHLPTLTLYAGKAFDYVTEFGVRDGCSTLALLMGKPKRLISYDINPCRNKPMLEQAAKELGVEWTFKLQDDCQELIEETDVLFIDTYHEYANLDQELQMHSGLVNQFIIMHDTNQVPDGLNGHSKEMWIAILKLVAMGHWGIALDDRRCNGLTILERIGR